MAHFGSYFETTEILALVPSLLRVIASGREALAREWKIAPEISRPPSANSGIVKPQTLEEDSRFSNPDPEQRRERPGFRRGTEDWPSCRTSNARRLAAHPPEL